MPMVTHIVVGTNDPDAAAKFYDAALGALGLEGEQRGPLRFYRRDPAGNTICAFTFEAE